MVLKTLLPSLSGLVLRDKVVPFAGNQAKYGKGVRIRGFTEGMWEIQNTPGVESKHKVPSHSLSLSVAVSVSHFVPASLCLFLIFGLPVSLAVSVYLTHFLSLCHTLSQSARRCLCLSYSVSIFLPLSLFHSRCLTLSVSLLLPPCLFHSVYLPIIFVN